MTDTKKDIKPVNKTVKLQVLKQLVSNVDDVSKEIQFKNISLYHININGIDIYSDIIINNFPYNLKFINKIIPIIKNKGLKTIYYIKNIKYRRYLIKKDITDSLLINIDDGIYHGNNLYSVNTDEYISVKKLSDNIYHEYAENYLPEKDLYITFKNTAETYKIGAYNLNLNNYIISDIYGIENEYIESAYKLIKYMFSSMYDITETDKQVIPLIKIVKADTSDINDILNRQSKRLSKIYENKINDINTNYKKIIKNKNNLVIPDFLFGNGYDTRLITRYDKKILCIVKPIDFKVKLIHKSDKTYDVSDKTETYDLDIHIYLNNNQVLDVAFFYRGTMDIFKMPHRLNSSFSYDGYSKAYSTLCFGSFTNVRNMLIDSSTDLTDFISSISDIISEIHHVSMVGIEDDCMHIERELFYGGLDSGKIKKTWY